MKKTIFAFVLAMVFLMGVVSAFEFDNVKTYEPIKKEVTITNTFGLGSDIAKLQLLTPQHNIVQVGNDVLVAEIQLNNYADYNNFFDKMQFYNKNKNNKEITKSFTFKYETLKDVEVQDYEQSCKESSMEKNGTINYNCENILVGSHIEQQTIWNDLNDYNLKAQNIKIGIFTNVEFGDYVEWIPQMFGVTINEWADYSSSPIADYRDCTDKLFFYKMNEGSGTAINDECGNYNANYGVGQPIRVPSLPGFGNASNSNNNNFYANTGLTQTAQQFTSFSVELRVNSSNSMATNPYMFGSASGADMNIRGWSYQMESGVPKILSSDGGGSSLLNDYDFGCGAINDGVYHHLVLVVNSSAKWVMYKDGVQCPNVATSNISFYGDAESPLYIHNRFSQNAGIYGTLEQVIYWNKSLLAQEVVNLNNSLTDSQSNQLTSLTINLTSPINNVLLNQSTIQFNSTATMLNIDLQNATLFVWNTTSTYYTANQVVLGNSTNSTSFQTTLTDGDYHWNVGYTGLNSSGQDLISRAPANYTLIIDTILPSLNLTSPITNQTAISFPYNVTLNFTASDSHLGTCWFNSTINATQTFFVCNSSQIVTIPNKSYEGNNLIQFGVNDSAGNTISSSTLFYLYYPIAYAIVSNPITEGATANYTLYLNMTNLANFDAFANLIVNGTSYGQGTKTFNPISNQYLFANSIAVPSINASSIIWLWNYNITGVTGNLNVTGNQTYISLNITECGANTYQIINMTMYDEKTKTISDGTNGSIEIDLNISTLSIPKSSWTFHGKKTGSSEYIICLNPGTLNSTTLSLDATIVYNYQSHVVQYHYLTNAVLSNNTIPMVLPLYDLANAESTSFLITYQDENYLYVKDAVVDLWRKYVGDGQFISVEHGKTDVGGQTRLHLTTEDVIYKILVWKNGILQYTNDEFTGLCQATPCQINLRKSQTTNESFSNYNNLIYTYSEDKTARSVTFAYSTSDGTSPTMNMTIVKSDNYGNETICSQQLQASAGSVSCAVPLTYSNATYNVIVNKDNKLFGKSDFSLSMSSMQIFGQTGIILTGLAFLMLSFMAISSGIATIVFGIIGLALMGMVQMFESGSVFGFGSAIIWLIVGGGIIIWKILDRRIS